MTKQINMRAGATANGGSVGILSSTGNPWTVTDDLANDLVNRGLATMVAADARSPVPVTQDPVTGQPASGYGNDLVVFGATPGGLFAAIAARKRGAKVVVLEPSQWVGGMLTGGLSATDIYRWLWSALVVGMASDFFADVAKELGQRQETFWRNGYAAIPSIFQRVLGRWLGEAGVTVIKGAKLVSATKSGTRITSITTSAGIFFGTTFVDGTYEGDLLAAAGCSYAIGREANSVYGETYGGVTALPTGSSQFTNVDPYITQGVAGSGFLPGIAEWQNEVLGAAGSASPRVMAYTYRLCMTFAGSSKIAMPEPSNYDPLKYELLGRHITNEAPAWTTLDAQALALALQGGGSKVDWNSGSYPMGTNYVHPECTEYVTASYDRRAVIAENVKQHILGWFKFMRTDSRVPAAVRTNAAAWGLCGDEFEAYGGFSPQLYVREGRRLVGDFVMTEQYLLNTQTFTDGVAIPYYNMDSPQVRRLVSGGVVKHEGATYQAIATGGVTVPFRAMKPKAAECTNLLVTFAFSASRSAFTSMRMEPISMACGEAAGNAAWIASQRGIDVASVSATEVQTLTDRFRFNTSGGWIIYADGTSNASQGTLTTNGSWNVGAFGLSVGYPSQTSSTATGAYKRFAPNLVATTVCDVYLIYLCQDANARSAVAPINVVHTGGTAALTVNQNSDSTTSPVTAREGGNGTYMGRYTLKAGNYVEVATDGLGGSTVITAVKFVPVK